MTNAPLARRLRLGDAVAIGLGSMIGAGVFAAFAPAAAAAGTGLLIGLAIAALIAWCNASSSAQLAAVHPQAGGSYLYGRLMLGPTWGFLAGWSFVIGKIASSAAMAITFASYAVPGPWQRPVAAIAVVLLTIVNCLGVTRTAQLTRVIVVISLSVLAVVVASGVFGPEAGAGWAGGADPLVGGWYGILQSAGLIFFAFAGYARIATMGEEVVDPARTIPRAIGIALGVAVIVYLAIGIVSLATLGPDRLASSTAPLVEVVSTVGWPWAAPVVQVGAAVASLGALLALVAGIGRTSLAMAREGDLPRGLAAVHPRFQTPYRAEIVVGVIVTVLVLTVDLRGAIAFSSFGVLLYYAVANASAFRQPSAERRLPRAVAVLGAAGCLVLVATLPWLGVVIGVAVVVIGLVLRAIFHRRMV